MRRGGQILILATVALVLLPSAAADAKKHKPKMTQCGGYSAADGSLAAQLVQSIAVSKGTSCTTGQSIAGVYTAQVGSFNASGWRCTVSFQIPGTSTVRCKRRSGVISYKIAAPTDCSSTPGASKSGNWRGPYVYNIDCGPAVPVYNSWVSQGANAPSTLPGGWTCTSDSEADPDSTDGDAWFSCVMGTQVVQGTT
jgi:hypothetical protein